MFDKDGRLIINTLPENMEFYREAYLKSLGLVDIAPKSALGSDLAITAEMKKLADEHTQFAISQQSPYEATDEWLDYLCFLRGIIRKINESSICLVTFSGADGIVIEKGTAVTNEVTNEIFITDEKGIITSGTFSVYATSVNAGRIACNANTLTATTIANVTVTNLNNGILGYLKESDTSLRARLLSYSNGLSVDEDLKLNLLNLLNVKYVNVVSNPKLIADANGIPAKNTAIVILGGDSKSIASIIKTTIPADKLTFGDISETIASPITNKEYVYSYSRPTPIIITLSVTITTNANFNPNDVGVIKESILNFFYDKFAIEDDVVFSTLYIPIQQDYNNNYSYFKGITAVAITINGATDNIIIAYNENAVLSSENLTLTVA